ncbi:MAG: DUF951 domain-containing protein [Saccharofermentanales bacterium]
MAGKFELYKFKPGDVLKLRKVHPCGSFEWMVERTGMDIGIRCRKCGHFMVIPRRKLEKAVKSVIPAEPCDIIQI